MKIRTFFAGTCFLLATLGTARRNVQGVEPVVPFLAALRQQKMFDEALEYLDLLRADARLDDELRQKLLYEQGVTLVEGASNLKDLDARNRQLSRAADVLAQFVKDHAGHESAPSAKNQMANILIERGRLEVALAQQTDKKEAALSAARKLFEQARQEFASAERDLVAQHQKLPKLIPETDKDLQSQKRQLSGDLAQLRLFQAGVDYELAKSYPPTSAEAKKHFKGAAKSYAALYDANRTRTAGLLARLWEGRCYQQMGDFKQALSRYQELLDLPSAPETRSIKTQSVRQALECWTKDSQKKYLEAIESGERWEKEMSGTRADDEDALAIRYLTALAYQGQANGLPAKDPNRKRLTGFARQSVMPVASHPGEYQRPAKMLLVALGAAKDKKPQKKDFKSETTSFADVFARGNQALEQMQEAERNLQIAQERLDGPAIENRPAIENKAAVEKLKRQKQEDAGAAREAFVLALTLNDSKVEIDEVNLARWYVCFLSWDAGQYYDAATVGEFLAHRYPKTLAGRKGARVALAAYLRLYAEDPSPEKPFETARLHAIADYTFKTWPNEEEADEAALTMLNFAASQRQFDKAIEYLAKISPNSPRRGQAELRAGQAMWSAYLRASQAAPESRPPQAELDRLTKLAQETLQQGITRMEKVAAVDSALAAGVFSVAQIYVETAQPEKAIEWLEHAKLGPLTLIKAKSPAAARDMFAVETYKLALRAYIAVEPQQLKKAEEAMDALEKIVQSKPDAKGAENLTAIYVSLGRQLQQHLESLRKSGQTKELESVTKSFEVFLDRVTKRDAGNSYTSLNWVGETYYNLGVGLDDGSANPQSPQAKLYFKKATTAYERMLELAEKDPKYQDQPAALVGARLRLAECFRRSGQFDQALKVLLNVLKANPTMLTVQVQAAETYQTQGEVDPNGYAMAILGGAAGKDGKNAIWGWKKISLLTGSKPQFDEIFHQSRLNMALARYRYALTQKDETKRMPILENAKHDLWITYKQYPDLGGNATLEKYDNLLRQVQKSLGTKESGLGEFKEKDAAIESADAKKN